MIAGTVGASTGKTGNTKARRRPLPTGAALANSSGPSTTNRRKDARPVKHTRAESAVELPCRQNDPELWFSEEPADVAAAKALCRSCPLRSECLDGALARREPYGVWGGELFLAGAIRERPVRRDKLDRTCAQCGGHISPKLRADAETCSRPCRERRARERIAERRAAGEAA